MNASALIDQFVSESLRVKAAFFEKNKEAVARTAQTIAHGLRTGKRAFFFGNGGSAADSQHLAAELVGRFGPDRAPLAGIALTTDTSILTAVANDHGYEKVFSRQIAALGQAGDTAIGISTSGNSPSVLLALDAARAKGMFTVGFTGEMFEDTTSSEIYPLPLHGALPTSPAKRTRSAGMGRCGA